VGSSNRKEVNLRWESILEDRLWDFFFLSFEDEDEEVEGGGYGQHEQKASGGHNTG